MPAEDVYSSIRARFVAEISEPSVVNLIDQRVQPFAQERFYEEAAAQFIATRPFFERIQLLVQYPSVIKPFLFRKRVR